VGRSSGGEVAVIILAIAALCLAVGASIALVLLALAVFYAMDHGYKPIHAQMHANANGETSFELTLG
jgi:hypothetical protein